MDDDFLLFYFTRTREEEDMSGYLASWSTKKKSTNEKCHDNVAQWKMKRAQWIENCLIPYCVEKIVKQMLVNTEERGRTRHIFKVHALSEELEPADFVLGKKDNKFVDDLAERITQKLVAPPHEFVVKVSDGSRVGLNSSLSFMEKLLTVELAPLPQKSSESEGKGEKKKEGEKKK